MSVVLGIDVSSHAIDMVKLDETTNDATWQRFRLVGRTAFERLRQVAEAMPTATFYDDVYLVAIETPKTRFLKSAGALFPVYGAVVAAIPGNLELWDVAPTVWRHGLGLPGNATKEQVALAAIDLWDNIAQVAYLDGETQDTYDAFAVALWARDENAKGIS